MSDDELLAELLIRWEDEYDRGRELTPQELCRDAPHLVERAAREIEKLKCMRPTPAVETTPPIPPPGQPMGPPPPPVRAFVGLRYEPQRHHASGGLGDVFVAVDEEVGREVALKRIKPQFADQPGDRARFEREAEITGRLEHPGVVPLYGRGRDADGRPYYAMRFIRGKSLRGAIGEFYKPDQAKKDPGERAVAFRGLLQRFMAACNTVAYAHSRGVIHRDLKPDNIMLGPYGETLVVDWGLAKYVGRDEPTCDSAEESLRPAALPDGEGTQTGATVGTPAFISPEQVLGRKDVGSATDVFSLGATLYQLLTGRPPYQGWQALVDAAAGKFPRPRHVRRDAPPALEAVCLQAMAFRPEERYATALELARDVDRWLADEPTAAYREPWLVRARRWVKRHRTPVAAMAAAFLVGALLVGGGLWWKADQEGRAAKEKERQEKAAARQADEMERDVQAALAETSRLEGEGQWEGAQAAAARADGRLAGGGPEDLRRRVGQAQTDLNLEARFEALAVEVVEPRPKIDRAGPLMGGVAGVRDPAQIDRDYAAVLRDDGAPLDATDPEEMAAWVRASAIREQLIQALDSWAYLKRDAKIDGAERLGEAAQRADGNDWRRRLRDLSARGDRAALEQLAGQNDVLEQPPPALADLGRSLSQVGATVVAVETLRKAQQRHPGDLGINTLLASVLSSTDSPDEDAIGFYRAALAIRPRNPVLHNGLGNVLDERGKPDEAAAEYRCAIDLDPKYVPAHDNLGLVLAKQGKLDEATAEYRRAIDLDPEDTLTRLGLGNVLDLQGKPDEAAAEYRRAIDLDPKNVFAHNNLGKVLEEQGKLEEAAAEYRRATDLDPKGALAHNGLGSVLDEQGKLEEAATECRLAIDLDPRYAFPHVNLGNVLDDQGKPDAAAAEYRRAIDIDPKDAVAHTNLGLILEKQGKPDEAAAEHRRAIDIDPKNALAHINLCALLHKQGKFDESISSWQRVIELPPPRDSPRPNWHIDAVYDAACAASLGAAGKGVDSGLDDKERARLRSQALDWLRIDLNAWDKRRRDGPKAGPEIQKTLQDWQKDSDLAGVRDADALAKLPEAEREAWRKLWADVDALLAKVDPATKP